MLSSLMFLKLSRLVILSTLIISHHLQGYILDQDTRTIVGINTLDSIETNGYFGPGVTSDRSTMIDQPVTWCKQTVDKVVNGRQVGKDRIQYGVLVMIYPYGSLFDSTCWIWFYSQC